MRTTLDIDPAVLSVARAKARAEHISLGRAVSDLAVQGMRRDDAARAESRNGFPVMRGVPGHSVTDEIVAEHRDEW